MTVIRIRYRKYIRKKTNNNPSFKIPFKINSIKTITYFKFDNKNICYKILLYTMKTNAKESIINLRIY